MLILSTDDNLPQILIESLFLGIPIIANNVKGVSEFLTHDFDSYIVSDPFDIDVPKLVEFLAKFKSNNRLKSVASSRIFFENNRIYQQLLTLMRASMS
jgi:glycosyltransferase involved in cell wall biosynthesis